MYILFHSRAHGWVPDDSECIILETTPASYPATYKGKSIEKVGSWFGLLGGLASNKSKNSQRDAFLTCSHKTSNSPSEYLQTKLFLELQLLSFHWNRKWPSSSGGAEGW